MAFSQDTADRIRKVLATLNEQFEEKKMFGGLSFLYKSKMTVGIVKEDLALRVIEEKIENALKKPYVKPMDFTKRPMKEFIFVKPREFKSEEQLMYWINLGLEPAKSKAE